VFGNDGTAIPESPVFAWKTLSLAVTNAKTNAAASSQPWTVQIRDGVYNIGISSFENNVFLQGDNRETVILQGSLTTNNLTGATPLTVSSNPSAGVRNLTIDSSGSNAQSSILADSYTPIGSGASINLLVENCNMITRNAPATKLDSSPLASSANSSATVLVVNCATTTSYDASFLVPNVNPSVFFSGAGSLGTFTVPTTLSVKNTRINYSTSYSNPTPQTIYNAVRGGVIISDGNYGIAQSSADVIFFSMCLVLDGPNLDGIANISNHTMDLTNIGSAVNTGTVIRLLNATSVNANRKTVIKTQNNLFITHLNGFNGINHIFHYAYGQSSITVSGNSTLITDSNSVFENNVPVDASVTNIFSSFPSRASDSVILNNLTTRNITGVIPQDPSSLGLVHQYHTSTPDLNGAEDTSNFLRFTGTTYSVIPTDATIFYNAPFPSSGIINLPPAAKYPGRILKIKNTSGQFPALVVTVNAAAGDSIDILGSSITLQPPTVQNVPGQAVIIQSDGVTTWWIMAGRTIT
jgi:hypothetical protein